MKNLKEVKQLWEKEFEAFFNKNTTTKSEGRTLHIMGIPTEEERFAFVDSFMDKYNLTEDEFSLVLDED